MKTLSNLLGVAMLAMPAAMSWAASPAPDDPHAAVPPYSYESSFRHFLPDSEPALQDWKAAHDALQQGGHAGMTHRRMPVEPVTEPAKPLHESMPSGQAMPGMQGGAHEQH